MSCDVIIRCLSTFSWDSQGECAIRSIGTQCAFSLLRTSRCLHLIPLWRTHDDAAKETHTQFPKLQCYNVNNTLTRYFTVLILWANSEHRLRIFLENLEDFYYYELSFSLCEKNYFTLVPKSSVDMSNPKPVSVYLASNCIQNHFVGFNLVVYCSTRPILKYSLSFHDPVVPPAK